MENTNSIPGRSSSSAASRGVDSAGAALHQGIDKLAGPVKSGMDSLSATAHDTVTALASSAGHVADRFADETRKISEAPGKALRYSKSSVQQRPLEAVGIALVFGFIVGRLTAH